MSPSLKDLNRPALVLVVVANVAIYFMALFGLSIAQLPEILKAYETYAPAALLALVVGVLNAQLDHKLKARSVFWRWEHPLPGSFAFTDVMHDDPRISPEALQTFVDPLPTAPIEQNRLWFKWYREFQDEPGIKQVHREYLFTRDWTSLVILFAIALVPLGFYQLPMTSALAWLFFLVVEYLLVRRAASNHGRRFVASVLAYKSASEDSK